MPATKAMDKETAKDLATPTGAGADAGPVVVEDKLGRTAEEKLVEQSKAPVAPSDKAKVKTLVELANGSAEEKVLAFQQLVSHFPQLFNIDFIDQAPIAQVVSGEAAARGAMSATGEDPARVDDQVIPPGFNNPTGEILPPNVMAGSDEAKALGFAEDAH